MLNYIDNVDYHVTDMCNLNCVSCGHFCSLVPKDIGHKSISQIARDLTALYKVTEFGTKLNHLSLTGGEASLSDQFSYAIYFADNYFHGKVTIWTNGIKYLEFDKIKDLIKSTGTSICMTDYGRTSEHTSKAIDYFYSNFGDLFHWTSRRTDEGSLRFFRGFFNLKGDSDINENLIKHCYSRTHCIQLKDEKLYICQYAAHIHYLLKYFKDQLTPEIESKLSNFDGVIDLTKDTKYSDVSEFIETAWMPMCNYCMDLVRWKYPDQEWGVTKHDLSEWILL